MLGTEEVFREDWDKSGFGELKEEWDEPGSEDSISSVVLSQCVTSHAEGKELEVSVEVISQSSHCQ